MAHSHTPRNRCVRFVFGVTAASRNTRFQAALKGVGGRQPVMRRQLSRVMACTLALSPYTLSEGFNCFVTSNLELNMGGFSGFWSAARAAISECTGGGETLA